MNETIESIFTNHNEIKLEINKEINLRNIWKIKKQSLNNP